ncbi:TerD family protein [Actinoplanes sp. URMC 104]|uniref:TerD family protein n=1 Tax=Actinoplanes sp. URMC 104 TaxID=3423409 RepID=UPI003F1D6303
MPIDYTKRAPTPPVSLSKVSLTKSTPTVSLTKQGSATGVLRVNLNWNQQAASGGGLFRKKSAPGVDLDLGCLYEYTDGSKGVVQALGGMFEDYHTFGDEPICRLDGDDRSGANSQGENLLVDLRHRDAIRRILVFAFIYEGVPNWAAADGVVTVFPASGPQIEVRLDEADDQAITCAIAMIENTGNDLSVRREIRYIRGGQDVLDALYGWGMQWSPGSK